MGSVFGWPEPSTSSLRLKHSNSIQLFFVLPLFQAGGEAP